MTIPKPKVLIIGEADEGTFEKTLHEYLLLNDRWAECSVESKSSPNLVATVKDMGKTASPRAWLNRCTKPLRGGSTLTTQPDVDDLAP